jgi:hypothetical protein
MPPRCRRRAGVNDAREQMLDQLLQLLLEMDGFGERQL